MPRVRRWAARRRPARRVVAQIPARAPAPPGGRAGRAGGRAARRYAGRPVLDHRPHPQLLDHQPCRPRQVDPFRPHPRADRRRRPPPHARAVPRLDGPRAGAGHHHQGPERAGAAGGTTSSTSSTPPATSTSATRSAGRWPPARAPSYWSTPPRASRPRPWPTATRPSRTTSRSWPSSTRSTCRRPTPSAAPTRSSRSSASTPPASSASRPRPAKASPSCSTPSWSASRHRRTTPGAPLRALIFDSAYDQYRGVVSSIRVMDGHLRAPDRLRFMQAGADHEVEEVGVRTPEPLRSTSSAPARWAT